MWLQLRLRLIRARLRCRPAVAGGSPQSTARLTFRISNGPTALSRWRRKQRSERVVDATQPAAWEVAIMAPEAILALTESLQGGVGQCGGADTRAPGRSDH